MMFVEMVYLAHFDTSSIKTPSVKVTHVQIESFNTYKLARHGQPKVREEELTNILLRRDWRYVWSIAWHKKSFKMLFSHII